MKKFLTVVGNRPQLIKLDRKFKTTLVYTGQHYDKAMKDVFFKGLKLNKPDYDLGETELGKMITKLTKVVSKEKPDYIILYGDTRSTLAGAIVALSENIKTVHIEAGCRSGDDSMIEERIRKFVDSRATIHLAPSEEARERLEMEGYTHAYNVGATQIDSMYNNAFPTKKPKDAFKYSVATVHRDFNTDNKENLQNIMEALGESGETIKLFIHPRTEEALKKFKIDVPKNIKIKKPVPYKKMINEIAFAKRVITDSGGLQVEAFFLRVPCVTLRHNTEWTETLDSGWNILVGSSKKRILDAISHRRRGDATMYCYGDGDANSKIRLLLNNL